MAVARVRQGGAWVASKLAGKARVGGAWVPFGPDGEPPVEVVSVFTSQTPATPAWVESSKSLTVGTVINVSAAGQVTGGRWLFPGTIPAGMTATYVLYDNLTGAQLRRAAFTNPTAGAWNVVTFAPVPVEAGTSLVAAVYLAGASGVGYPVTPQMFANGGVTNGALTAPRSNDEPRIIGNGRFVSSDTYPAATYNATSYFVDLLYEGVPTAGGGDIALTNPDRPVLAGQPVSMAGVTATDLAAGETILGYSWSVRSGGGSLSSNTGAAPTYTAPTGAGVAVVRSTVTTSQGRIGWADVRVGYAGNVVAAENALPGVPRASWDLPVGELAGVASLQGFCDGFSIDKTQTANFKVGQSDGAGWSAEVFRLGWYGGNGARLVATLTPSGTQLAASQAQPDPTDVDPGTSLLSADCGNWSTTLTWTPPAWAPSGVYVLRLNRVGGGASHVMFVLRDDVRTADLMLMPSDSTWQAYNAFGGMGSGLYAGNSLYYGTTVNQYHSDAARFVSYNRPIVNRGAADPGRAYGQVEWSTFFTGEYGMLRFVERNGFDVKYYGCIDAAADATGAKLSTVKAALAVGHNEYWSDGMRAGWEAAKAAGTSLFFSAGNEVFWRLVGSNSDTSGRPRTWECFKSTIAARSSTSRAQWTGTWRDPDGAGKGGDLPENTLTGTIFAVNGPDFRSLVVPHDGGYSATPLWRNTTVAALAAGQSWTSPAQILGFEWDTYGPAGTSSATAAVHMADPHPAAVYCSDAAYSIPAGRLLTDAGDVYDADGTATHRLVVHPGGNGAIVFGTGTVNWPLGLDNANTYQVGSDNTAQPIQQATVNMLVDMGATPRTLMSGLTTPVRQLWYGGTPGESWALGVPAGNPDFADAAYSLGVRFAVTAAGSWIGVRVWGTPTAPSISPSVMAYNDDTGVRLALKSYTEPGTRGQYYDVLFDAAVPVATGVNYQAAVHTNRYGFTANSGLALPMQSPSGKVRSAATTTGLSRLVAGASPATTKPASNSTNYMHMAPIVAFD